MGDPLANPYPLPLLAWRAWVAAAFVLLYAWGWGWVLLGQMRGMASFERLLLRSTIGLGSCALVLLAWGQRSGGFEWTGPVATLASAVVFTLAWRIWSGRQRPEAPTRNLEANLKQAGPDRRARDISALAGGAALGLFFLLLLGPALAPPANYDVLEYHLGVVPHWFSTGRITPLPHVFYSAQPCATELWFGFAALAEGTPWGHAPGLLHWGLVLLAAMTMLQALRAWRVPRAWRAWAVLLLLVHPIWVRISYDRLTDLTGVLYLAAGLWIAAQARRKQLATVKAMILLGALAGFGLGSKWTHAGTVAAPLGCLALWLVIPSRNAKDNSRDFGSILKGILFFGAMAVVAWLPWGVWLWRERGNPFAPFLASIFQTPSWGPERLGFLMQTHGRHGPWQADYWLNLVRRLGWELNGLPIIALGLAALVIAMLLHVAWRGRVGAASRLCARGMTALLAGLVIGLLLWGQLTHAADRFLAAPMLLASLIGLKSMHLMIARSRVGRALIAVILAVPALWGLNNYAQLTTAAWSHALGKMTRWQYLRGESERFPGIMGITAELFRAANTLPEGSRVLAINEARRYYFARDVDVVSVFDASPLIAALRAAPDAPLAAQLRNLGYTHVLVNEIELQRILHIHTPPELIGNQRFAQLMAQTAPLPQNPPADAQLVREFHGYLEFATVPLAPAERARYETFYAESLQQAQWISVISEAGRPAMWISSLEQVKNLHQ